MRSQHLYSQLGSLSRSLLQRTSHVRLREFKLSASTPTLTGCQKSYSQFICLNQQQHRVSVVQSWLNRSVSLPSCLIHTATPSSLLSSRRGSMTNLEDARQFVASLTSSQRSTLEEAIQEIKTKDNVTASQEAPSWNQLKLLCYQHALPFIGFGFLDNVIMITVGEYIDSTLGIVLGISTMAAAGIGNMISDLAGLGLADRVEALCTALGIPNPNLSSSQLKQRASRMAALFGRCVGIIIGCTVGMAPLLFFNDPHKKHDDE